MSEPSGARPTPAPPGAPGVSPPSASATRPIPADAAGIQAEIERTRAELARTVDALSARLDVPARAKEKVAGVRADLQRGLATVRANPVPTAAALVLVASAVALVIGRKRR